MKNLAKIALIFGSLLFLVACQPQYFGMPKSQWDTLTPAQQQQVIKSYNKQQQIKQENAPLQSAIDAAGDIIKTQQQQKALDKGPYVPNMNSGFPTVH